MNEITKTYSDGLKDAWEAAYRISMMTNEEKYKIFDVSPRDNVFECFSAAHVIEVMAIKDAARHNRITKTMLEKYMYEHGVCNVDLDDPVAGSLMLDIVNDIVSDLVKLGTVRDVLEQME